MGQTCGSIDQGSTPRPATSAIAPQPTPVWPQTGLGLGLFAGACLMLYGSAQNSTAGPGPTASTIGTAVVATIAAVIVGAAMRHTVRDHATARRTGRFFEFRCTTCNTQLPGHYRAPDSDAMAKAVRKHDEDAHSPHDPAILQILAVRIALIQAGTVDAPATVRHYEVTPADRTITAEHPAAVPSPPLT
jgi:hypothetical protein